MSEIVISVLLYHRVSNEISKVSRANCVSPRMFDGQMRFIRERGYNVVSLHEVKDALDGKRVLAEKSVVITLDDGYRDTYYNAFPILQKYGMRATVFLVSNLIGATNLWDQSRLGTRPVPLLSLSEIREMSRYGVDFGSHTRTHPRLPLLDVDNVEAEIAGSKRDLENLLGSEVRFFAYPYFAVDDRVRRAVRAAGYAAACGGASLEGSTQFDINRSLISHENWLLTCMKLLGWHRQIQTNPVLRAFKDRLAPAQQVAGSAARSGMR